MLREVVLPWKNHALHIIGRSRPSRAVLHFGVSPSDLFVTTVRSVTLTNSIAHGHTLTITMSPNPSGPNHSPVRKRLQMPLPASPHRTTSQLSVVSVGAQAHNTDAARPLLSQTIRSRSSSAPLRPSATPSASSSSSQLSAAELSIAPSSPSKPASRSTTPALGSGPGSTRKGKERAVEGVDEVDVSGEMAVESEGDAARGLRRLVRQSEDGGVRGMAPAVRNTTLAGEEGLVNLKPPDRE